MQLVVDASRDQRCAVRQVPPESTCRKHQLLISESMYVVCAVFQSKKSVVFFEVRRCSSIVLGNSRGEKYSRLSASKQQDQPTGTYLGQNTFPANSMHTNNSQAFVDSSTHPTAQPYMHLTTKS